MCARASTQNLSSYNKRVPSLTNINEKTLFATCAPPPSSMHTHFHGKVLDAIETTPQHSSLHMLALTFYIHHLSVFLQPEGGES